MGIDSLILYCIDQGRASRVILVAKEVVVWYSCQGVIDLCFLKQETFWRIEGVDFLVRNVIDWKGFSDFSRPLELKGEQINIHSKKVEG